LAAEVALQQLDGIRSRILAEGDDFDSWLQNDQIPSFDWADLDFRLDWPDYVKILEVVLSRRSPEWMAQSGELSIHAPGAHLFKVGLLIGFDDPCTALEWMCSAIGPFAAVSPFLQSTLENKDRQSYVLRSTMLGELKPCQAYHYYSQGILQGFPCVLAERRAQVEVEPRADGADYHIKFKPKTLFGGARRRWRRGRPQPAYLSGIGETYLALVQRQIDLQEEQDKVRKAQLRAAKTEKQESLGYLTSGVSHDFRNLLTVVQGQLELALLDAEGQQRESLEEALAACQRGAELTERLLSYARKAPSVPEDVDISEALSSVQPILEKGLGSNAELRVNMPSVAQKIRVERVLFENALLNLVINAGDAIENEGVVTIHTELTRILEGSSLAADCTPGDYIKISVEDNGVGIDSKIAQRIFDPYFTTKDQGTGLGLSSVWGFVKQHGGHVVLEPNNSQGSRFNLYLPKH
jgi:signal transduction histidine kinase